jgi:hypothetical protein
MSSYFKAVLELFQAIWQLCPTYSSPTAAPCHLTALLIVFWSCLKAVPKILQAISQLYLKCLKLFESYSWNIPSHLTALLIVFQAVRKFFTKYSRSFQNLTNSILSDLRFFLIYSKPLESFTCSISRKFQQQFLKYFQSNVIALLIVYEAIRKLYRNFQRVRPGHYSI